MRKILKKNSIKPFKIFDENNLNSLPRIFLSSVLVILFFYSLPIIINFTHNKIESSAGIQNNSKAILAYTLNKKSSNSSNSLTLNEDDLLIDIYSLNDQETDTVRLDASTIKQLFEDTDYKLDDVRKKKISKTYSFNLITCRNKNDWER